jgi:hypothetical protein
VLERIEPAVVALVEHVEAETDYVEPAVADEGFAVVDGGAAGAAEHGEEGG